MTEIATLQCDSCGTVLSKDELPEVPRPRGAVNPRDFIAYRMSIRPLTRPVENTLGGTYFDLCAECVLKHTHGLGREEGDNLPPVPEPAGFEQHRICTCGATEYLEGSFAEYCSNGHIIRGDFDPFREEPTEPSTIRPPRRRLRDRVLERFAPWLFPGA